MYYCLLHRFRLPGFHGFYIGCCLSNGHICLPKGPGLGEQPPSLEKNCMQHPVVRCSPTPGNNIFCLTFTVLSFTLLSPRRLTSTDFGFLTASPPGTPTPQKSCHTSFQVTWESPMSAFSLSASCIACFSSLRT